MSDSKDELIKTISLLGAELLEERERFRSLLTNTPIGTRKKEGVTWYPVVIANEEMGLGERLIIEVERNENEKGPSLFQQGSAVSLFSNHDENQKQKPSLAGVVIRSSFRSLRVALDVDELPDWAFDGKLGLDLYFDERSFMDMAKAMNEVVNAEKGRLAELREILLGYSQPSFDAEVFVPEMPGLNTSQQEAIAKVATAQDVAVIHGPPGTGKTTALVASIMLTLKTEKQVLVCAASNLAVDLLATRLADKGASVLRLGHPARLSEAVLELSLDEKVMKHSAYPELKPMRREAEQIRRGALRFRRNFGKAEREQRGAMLAESRELMKQVRRLEDWIVDDLLDKSQVIVCTLSGTASGYLSKRRFTTVFIDEAAQALEPSCWLAILKAERVIFAGDHCQLPPTVKSQRGIKEGLTETLFEKCMKRLKAGVMLRTQYRMHETIMQFPSRWFYQNGLEAAPEVAHALLPVDDPVDQAPVEFIDTAGTGWNEKQNPETLSYGNEEECRALLQRLEQLLQALPADFAATATVGVIAPYKDQVKRLEEGWQQSEWNAAWKGRVSVDTVDGFQGQERDLILMSLVRSNDKNEIGFLADVRRMNVAMTRAKRKLVVMGDSATIGGGAFYNAWLDFVDACGLHRTAWEL